MSFIQKTLDAVILALKDVDFLTEIIIVNDGSTDKTSDLIGNWCKQSVFDGQIQVILLENNSNYGQPIATINGLKASNGTFAVIFDDDLQYLPEEILSLLTSITANEQIEMVGGTPKHVYHQRSIWIDLVSRLGKFLLGTIFFPTFKNVRYFTSFKIFRRAVLFGDDGNFRDRNIYFFWDYNPRNIASITVQHQQSMRFKTNYNFIGFIRTFHHVLLKVVQKIARFTVILMLFKALVLLDVFIWEMAIMGSLFLLAGIIEWYLHVLKGRMLHQACRRIYLK